MGTDHEYAFHPHSKKTFALFAPLRETFRQAGKPDLQAALREIFCQAGKPDLRTGKPDLGTAEIAKRRHPFDQPRSGGRE